MLRRFIIPDTLEGLATLLESFSSGGECSSSSDVVDPFIAEREKLSVMAKKISPGFICRTTTKSPKRRSIEWLLSAALSGRGLQMQCAHVTCYLQIGH